MDSGSARPYNYGAFIVTPLLDDEPYRRKRFIQMILNFWKPLVDSSFARVVVKYNITEQYQTEELNRVEHRNGSKPPEAFDNDVF